MEERATRRAVDAAVALERYCDDGAAGNPALEQDRGPAILGVEDAAAAFRKRVRSIDPHFLVAPPSAAQVN